MSHKVYVWGLWISTIAVLLIAAIQALSGNWITFFLIWAGGPAPGETFIRAMVALASYHRAAGFTAGGMSVLILFFAFFSKSNVYVRVFAVTGFIMTALAVAGGFLFVTSGTLDRWALGQMADAFVGVFGTYFIQLFFMNRIPGFPWSRTKPR